MTARLVVIDMQNIFADPASPWSTPRFAETLEPVRRLAEAAGPARTTYTRFVAPAEPTGAWRRYYERWPFALQPPDAPAYRLVDGLGPVADTVDATTFSKWTPALAARAGTGPLLLAGVSTDCCVLATALAAADAGVAVRVVADACAGADDDSHRMALDVMRLYGPLIEVVGLAQALDALGEPS